MTRAHGSSMAHACFGTSCSPDVKHIRVGEEEAPVPLPVNDESSIVMVPLEKEEVPIPLPVCDESSIVTVLLEEEEVVLVPLAVQAP
jgi:hypothetical protein